MMMMKKMMMNSNLKYCYTNKDGTNRTICQLLADAWNGASMPDDEAEDGYIELDNDSAMEYAEAMTEDIEPGYYIFGTDLANEPFIKPIECDHYGRPLGEPIFIDSDGCIGEIEDVEYTAETDDDMVNKIFNQCEEARIFNEDEMMDAKTIYMQAMDILDDGEISREDLDKKAKEYVPKIEKLYKEETQLATTF